MHAGALNHEFKDLRVWIRYRNLDVSPLHLKEARTPEAWFPTEDEMERIKNYFVHKITNAGAEGSTQITHREDGLWI
ncbi:MAG: hypothetical protein RE471_09245 [Ferroplasma sp.]|uniref:hypothetical protein n=1 Tax=Ferroplasma sp. TaxID=2591003 RepID=UPI0028158276|nr:hypothetical protein [Ferroplasma sp.]WMT51064.1 MAG: hypothetical protein RE471_08810 [Ferroplasma sp.]WMT51149.1 MAG: hypothetical protein RE471_09245 [Ferroplasma sp.]